VRLDARTKDQDVGHVLVGEFPSVTLGQWSGRAARFLSSPPPDRRTIADGAGTVTGGAIFHIGLLAGSLDRRARRLAHRRFILRARNGDHRKQSN